ncbi:hypothetical protein QQ991_11285 [Weizmannia coagulans]|jgi:hypothetical protein|uniref:Uncharacterized protein n=3 Tax=Heyndrickxia TaxID=2837504 RepID=A0A0C5CN46_HEYCO|nr:MULTISPECIES: hypothetical protein [Heyndrickxia]AEP02107.1 hypothetical protein Bcoa_2931 [Heyndrickxia coagulans 36D1]AJO22752.1 hypothetical protein SB48_HM08orf03103 [Heyndrickxia coagulans]AKN55732.1 hypothetical protein AB434_3327 [Heyndrickxia coagulans]APB36325.1 hypothetical protein BIZ35_05460 [Heyndrickxia coagulans]ATW83009.1 hypothetical protein CIW84_08490 [Heyndrickxia coagulans]
MSDEKYIIEMEKRRQKLEPAGKAKEKTEKQTAAAVSRAEKRKSTEKESRSRLPLVNLLAVIFILVPIAVYICYTFLFFR